MEQLIETWLNTEDIEILLDPQALVFFFLAIIIFFIGKAVNNFVAPYNLNDQLTKEDNKAVGLSFAGYVFALSIVISGLLAGESDLVSSGDVRKDLIADLLNTGLWGIIAIVYLQIAKIINDKLLLSRFDNVKELIKDKNVGTGAVQFGSLVGSALIIRACLGGEGSESFSVTLLDTSVYFVISQIVFIIFGVLYQKVTRFDLHDEIEKDNVAAGVAFGLSLISVSILLSGYILKYESFIGLAIWTAISFFLLLTGRYVVDKVMLPGSLLDEEISKDQNWGAAIVEGASAIGIALVLTAVF